MSKRLKPIFYKAVLLSMVVGLLGFTIALAASGDLDTSFGDDGLLTTNFGPSNPGRQDSVEAIAIQSNGKIIAVGFSEVPSTSTVDFVLARYNSNGSLDTTFSADGKQITNFGGYDVATDVAVQSDGKIIASGYTCTSNGEVCDLALVRYNPDGGLDTTFSGDGKQITNFGGGDNGSNGGLEIQSNGKIVVAGWMWNGTDHDFAVYRYNANGTLDSTFSGDGLARFGFGVGRKDSARSMDIQDSDGKIVVVGYSDDVTGNNNFAIARLNPNGTLDTTFAGDGRQTTDFGGNDSAFGFAGQANGKMVVVGQQITGTSKFAVARYNPNGSLDTTFNGTGRRAFGISAGIGSYATDVVVQPDLKIVVLGGSNSDFALVRLNPNGAFDNTFSGNGKVTVDFCNSFAEGHALVRQPSDGRYVLGGTSGCSGGLDFTLARVLP